MGLDPKTLLHLMINHEIELLRDKGGPSWSDKKRAQRIPRDLLVKNIAVAILERFGMISDYGEKTTHQMKVEIVKDGAFLIAVKSFERGGYTDGDGTHYETRAD